MAALEEAKQLSDQAREEMEGAPDFDAAADRAAAEAGEEMPERTEPAKRAAFALANREAQALEQPAKDRVVDLFEAIAAHRADWLDKLEPAVAEQRAEIADVLAAVPGMFRRLETSERVLEAVRGYQGTGQPDEMFGSVDTGPRAERRRQRREERIAGELATSHRDAVPREVPYLLQALRQLVEESGE